MTKRRSLAVAVSAAAALAAGAGAPGFADADRTAPMRVEARGEPVPVAPAARTIFAELRYDDLRLLAVENGHAYYTLRGPRGVCYAVGFSNDVGMPGHVKCAGSGRAIVDFTYVEATRSDPELRVYRTEGIVADGVAEIEVADADGRRLAGTPVRNNVFQFMDVPKGARRLIARGRDGRELAAAPLR